MYIHIKHAPVKLFARVSLAFRVFLVLQGLRLTFPSDGFGHVFPIDDSEDIELDRLSRASYATSAPEGWENVI